MPTKLEKLLEILSDNVWHNPQETARILQIPPEKFQNIIKFLADTDLIQHNPATNQIKLNQDWKTLLINRKTPNTETEVSQPYDRAIGTIIIPPQKSLVIQCTRITNLTDTSLELEIRINKKINEIAISKIK